jgi:D-alanine transaminase
MVRRNEPLENAYMNGRYLHVEDAVAPVMDRGYLFGDSVYEVVPVYWAEPFRLDAHLARLNRSLSEIGIDSPLNTAGWYRLTERLVDTVKDPTASLYIQVTRGTDPTRDHAGSAAATPTVFAMINPLTLPDPQKLEVGFSAITLDDIRWSRCDIKTTALLANVMARREAKSAGADEAILIRNGKITEGAASNVFLVLDGRLLTPPVSNNLLAGITRELVLEIADDNGIDARESDLSASALENADEIWLTSSTREIVPVTQLNGHRVGTGSPGRIWRRMFQLFNNLKKQGRDSLQG